MDGLFLYIYIVKIVVFTCVYKRRELTELFFKSLKRQELDVYCAYSELEDYDMVKKYAKAFMGCANNPLSNKFNYALGLLRNVDFDYAMILGSDNFISDNFIDVITPHLTHDYIVFNDIHFYDTLTSRVAYMKYENTSIAPIGAGSLFSKKLLDKMNYTLWDEDLNYELDTNRHKNLRSVGCKTLNTQELSIEMVDVKHEVNITNPVLLNAIQKSELKLINKEIFCKLAPKDVRYLTRKKKIKLKNMKTYRITKDHLDLTEGSEYRLNPAVGRDLVLRGIAIELDGDNKSKKAEKKQEAKSDEDLTLKELRKKYPDIVANSKAKFLKKLEDLEHECDDCDDDNPCEGCEKAAKTTNIPDKK